MVHNIDIIIRAWESYKYMSNIVYQLLSWPSLWSSFCCHLYLSTLSSTPWENFLNLMHGWMQLMDLNILGRLHISFKLTWLDLMEHIYRRRVKEVFFIEDFTSSGYKFLEAIDDMGLLHLSMLIYNNDNYTACKNLHYNYDLLNGRKYRPFKPFDFSSK